MYAYVMTMLCYLKYLSKSGLNYYYLGRLGTECQVIVPEPD